MDQITTAHWAINIFMSNASDKPDWGMPRPALPAFTDNSMFASRVMNTLQSKNSAFTSPRHEDAAWASVLEEDTLTSCHRAASDDPPITSTSYVHLDKGKGKDLTEFPSGHAAWLAAPTTTTGHREGEHDANDESEQLVSKPPQTDSNQTLSHPASRCPSPSQHSSGARQSSSSSITSRESGLHRMNAMPNPLVPPSHSSRPSPSLLSSMSHTSRNAQNQGPWGKEDSWVPKVHLVWKVSLVTTVRLDLLDPLVHLATEVTLVHQAHQAHQALQAPLVQTLQEPTGSTA